MRLPYLCHFRVIIHTWDTEVINGETCDIAPGPMFEDLHSEIWTEKFTFRNLKQKEKDENDLGYWLKECEKPGFIKMSAPSEYDPTYFNEHTKRCEEYGRECLTDDIIEAIIESDLKNPTGERYFEIMGRLHEYTSQDYWGEWDSNCQVEDVKFQEIHVDDVNKFCRHENINLKD